MQGDIYIDLKELTLSTQLSYETWAIATAGPLKFHISGSPMQWDRLGSWAHNVAEAQRKAETEGPPF